ncbi:ester hydrolase C11orf54 homolog [Ooceraea biroi]|uniref:ester hydrolase C11orf54 homolog n=1 Tax=Ooceraea biroi TaxID=2015173 RepID=UPI000971634A|nr:ester hydrolase C11orf54 homolog [Ooceraea biroi]XP_026830080.1 ester hydrolase C11orf54 homolog [Ooceraea biroi]
MLPQLYTNLMFSPTSPTGSMNFRNDSITFCSVEETNNTYARNIREFNSLCVIQGNFFLSERRPGKVLQVTAHCRTGPLNFVSAIQELFNLMRTETDPLIGLGGMFMVSGSPTLHHIMPAYSRVTNLYTMKQVQQWLRYRKLIEPVTAVGTIMSEGSYYNNICPNSTELPYLTKSHFHSHTLNQPRSCGGHFYTNCVNTNYLDAFYVGYFSFAEKLYCVDPPSRRDIHTNIDKFYPPCQNHNIGVINIREEYN